MNLATARKYFISVHPDLVIVIRRNGKTYIKKTKKEEEAKLNKVVPTTTETYNVH